MVRQRRLGLLAGLGAGCETVASRGSAQYGVRYRDIEDAEGYDYYVRSDLGIGLFFANDRVTALCVTRTNLPPDLD